MTAVGTGETLFTVDVSVLSEPDPVAEAFSKLEQAISDEPSGSGAGFDDEGGDE